MKRSVLIGAVSGALISGASVSLAGVTYNFGESCTNNIAGDVLIGMTQLTVEVSSAPGSMVDFTFLNSGPAPCSITDLYWDDGSLLAIGAIFSGPGTAFSLIASPGNLPGGNNCTPPFVTTVNFSADSDPPVQHNGVNPGEYVTVRFSLQGTQTYADVLDELNTGTLRIGIHVQGYATGGSESFVNTIPAPGAAAVGLLGLVALRRRR